MSSLFLVCLGGSGSKVMEAVAHMAAMDAWSARTIHALLVDVDGGNGNQDRARSTVEAYSSVQGLQAPNPYKALDVELFRSQIHLYPWYPTSKNTNLAAFTKPSENSASAILSRFLFTEDELKMNVDEGFKGHPNLGVIFMQKILEEQATVSESELAKFLIAALHEKAELTNSGEELRIFLIGSCFGGTGASCIPMLGRFLRNRLGDDIRMGLLAMLPTFSLRKTKAATSIDPDSNVFDNRVKTVLSTYIDQEVLQYTSVRDGIPRQIYDHIYLLGSPELIPYHVYAPGRSTQENPATFFDWFACSAIHHFFDRTQPTDEEPMAGYHQSVLTAWLDQGPWDWSQMDTKDFPRLQMKATKLMIAVGVYMSEMYLSMQKIQDHNQRKRENHLLGYFQHIPTANLQGVKNDLQPYAEYCALLVLWFFQIASNLPKSMFPDMGVPAQRNIRSSDELKQDMENSQIREEDRGMLYSLYYQQFFNPVALFHMECLRRAYWPRGNENSNIGLASTETLVSAFTAIFHDQQGPDEVRRLGALLNSVTKSSFYPHATADAILGRVYANEAYLGEPKYAAYTLLNRIFKAIDMMVRR